MLTPQEVSERAFAKASFGGYNMAMVDEFLDTLTEDYTALYKENTALKAKMKVLVEKVEEYRATEDAMRKALLTAQTMADEMVREAERKQAQMLSTAEAEAREKMTDIRQEIANEEARLVAAQNATAVYVGKLREMYRREMEHLDALEAITAPKVATPKAVDPVVAAVAEIEASMNRMRDEEPAPVAASAFEHSFGGGRPAEDEEDTLSFGKVDDKVGMPSGEEEDSTRRLNLDDLQFGKDFDL